MQENIAASGSLFIHFGVTNNQIPITQSITTEESLRTIITEFNKNLFNSEVPVDINVSPAKKGKHLKKITITTEGTTLLSKIPETANITATALCQTNLMDVIHNHTIEAEKAVHLLVTAITNFLAADSYTLEQAGISTTKFPNAYRAKNNLYKACIDNKNLKKLGFEEATNFPLKRNEFATRYVEFGKKDVEPVEKIHKLKVVSSIQTKEEECRAWQVKDINGGRVFTVYMKDEAFYEYYWENNLQIKNFVVKIRYALQTDKTGNFRFKEKGKEIVQVYQYNNEHPIIELADNKTIDTAPFNLDSMNGKTQTFAPQETTAEDVQMSLF